MERGEFVRKNSDLFDRSSPLVVAAHELKSPLALLRQLSFELSDGVVDSEEQRIIINQMQVVAERAMRLTNNITKTTLVDQTVFPFEPVNPSELCEDVIHELSPLYKALGCELQLEKRVRTTPLVIANRELLRRILLNFGDNALHYANSQPVLFSVNQIGNEVQVALRDRGPITSLKTMKKTNSGLSGRPESSGLGLEICSAFAQAMNGYISSTRHHDGMTFYVRLQPSTQMSLL